MTEDEQATRQIAVCIANGAAYAAVEGMIDIPQALFMVQRAARNTPESYQRSVIGWTYLEIMRLGPCKPVRKGPKSWPLPLQEDMAELVELFHSAGHSLSRSDEDSAFVKVQEVVGVHLGLATPDISTIQNWHLALRKRGKRKKAPNFG